MGESIPLALGLCSDAVCSVTLDQTLCAPNVSLVVYLELWASTKHTHNSDGEVTDSSIQEPVPRERCSSSLLTGTGV